MVHLAGAVCIAMWLVMGYFASYRLRRTAQAASPAVVALLNETIGSYPTQRKRLQVLTHDRIDVAVALGIWQPAILLPARWIDRIPLPLREGHGEGSPRDDLRAVLRTKRRMSLITICNG